MKFKGIERVAAVNGNTTITYHLPNMAALIMVDGQEKLVTPFLKLSPATSVNKPYQSAKLRVLQEDAREMKKLASQGVTSEFMDAQIDQDRPLYVNHIIRDWGDFYDDETGELIPYNKANCKELLAALPNFEFENIREEAVNINNFIQDQQRAPVTAKAKEELIKN